MSRVERRAAALRRSAGAHRPHRRARRARCGRFSLGPLVLRDARVRKAGDGLVGEASITEADLRAALPAGL